MLPLCLAAVRENCPNAAIIVVDGGSSDSTNAVAAAAGATVVTSVRGRGRQQNEGAEGAVGDILLFLHADTLLPPGAESAIRTALSLPYVAGGNFTLEFTPRVPLNHLFAFAYNLRSRRARHYYGDSVLFLRRSVFEELGGFREGMLMEDWEFICRLEAHCQSTGQRTVLLPLIACTSSRRFTGRRRLRYLFLWSYLHLLHAGGISGDALARLYPDER